MNGQYFYLTINACYTNCILVKPEQVHLVANETRVCQNDLVSFTCSAVGIPVVHTYQFYENDALVGSSSAGVWSRALSTGGLFIYKCVANNTVGTAESMSIHVTVNGTKNVALLRFFDSFCGTIRKFLETALRQSSPCQINVKFSIPILQYFQYCLLVLN